MLGIALLILNLLLASSVAGLIVSFFNRGDLIRSSWALQRNHQRLAWGLRLIAGGYGALSLAMLMVDRMDGRLIAMLCLFAYPALIGGVVCIEAATWPRPAAEERKIRWGY